MSAARLSLAALMWLCQMGRTLAASPLSPTVVVLHDPGDPIAREGSVRLGAELASAGFSVVQRLCTVEDEPCAPDDPNEAGLATIDLRTSDIEAVITVRHPGSPEGEPRSRRLRVTSPAQSRSASFLAIQAYDLFLLVRGEKEATDKVPIAVAPATAAASARHPHPRFAIDLGGAVLPGLRGLTLAGGPSVHFWWLRPRGAALALGVSGPAFGRAFRSSRARATVRQEAISLLFCYRPIPGGRVQPALCGGAGLYHAAIQADVVEPEAHHSASHWTPHLDFGIGTFVALPSRFVLDVQARTWWLRRYPRISIGGEKFGETGFPALVLVGGLGRVF